MGAILSEAINHQMTLTANAPRDLQQEFVAGTLGPNRVIGAEKSGFVENSWIGRTLAMGYEVVLLAGIPCPRCVMPTSCDPD